MTHHDFIHLIPFDRNQAIQLQQLSGLVNCSQRKTKKMIRNAWNNGYVIISTTQQSSVYFRSSQDIRIEECTEYIRRCISVPVRISGIQGQHVAYRTA